MIPIKSLLLLWWLLCASVGLRGAQGKMKPPCVRRPNNTEFRVDNTGALDPLNLKIYDKFTTWTEESIVRKQKSVQSPQQHYNYAKELYNTISACT